MAPDRTHPGLLRRRTFAGPNFDLLNTSLLDGSHPVTAIETTAQIAARGGRLDRGRPAGR